MWPKMVLPVALANLAVSQQLARDPVVGGVQAEVVHLYYDEYPQGTSLTTPYSRPWRLIPSIGIAVSSTGRRFSNYARSLDPNNIAYTVAELMSNNTETAYPSVKINSPPGGAINYTTSPATGANYVDYLIGVQSVVIDPKDRLWILDTGRAAMQNGTNVPASLGGPKLIGVNLQNDSIFTTIVFPPNVAYSDSVSIPNRGIATVTKSRSVYQRYPLRSPSQPYSFWTGNSLHHGLIYGRTQWHYHR